MESRTIKYTPNLKSNSPIAQIGVHEDFDFVKIHFRICDYKDKKNKEKNKAIINFLKKKYGTKNVGVGYTFLPKPEKGSKEIEMDVIVYKKAKHVLLTLGPTYLSYSVFEALGLEKAACPLFENIPSENEQSDSDHSLSEECDPVAESEKLDQEDTEAKQSCFPFWRKRESTVDEKCMPKSKRQSM